MKLLKAPANEIRREDISEAEMVVVEGRVVSQSGKLMMNPGEFYFRLATIAVFRKQNIWQKLLQTKPKQTFRMIDTIVIICPFCSTPILTKKYPKVLKRRPLTIQTPIPCPNVNADGKAHSFSIQTATDFGVDLGTITGYGSYDHR